MAIPTKIKDLLKEAGLTQVALASKAGVDRGVIGRILRGTQRPTHDQACWIAEALDCSVEDIFPDGAFRKDTASAQQNAALAERVRDMEAELVSLRAENTNLHRTQGEIITDFSARLSSIHEEKAQIEQTLTEAQNDKKKLQAQNFGLRFELFRRNKMIESLSKQVESAESEATTFKGLAILGGGAAVFGAIAALSDS